MTNSKNKERSATMIYLDELAQRKGYASHTELKLN